MNIGSCVNHFCYNGGKCGLDMSLKGNSPVCKCSSGYAGPDCRKRKVCEDLPCKNKGICHSQAVESFRLV